MKHTSILALALTIGVSIGATVTPAQAQTPAAAPVQIQVNKQIKNTLKKPLLNIKGRTMIQVNDLAALINAKVKSGTGATEVFLNLNGTEVGFRPNTDKVNMGGEWKASEQGAITQAGEVYVPLRYALESFSYQVGWNAAEKMIEVNPMTMNTQDQFTVVDESTLTAEEVQFVNSVKQTKGVHRKGNLFVVARGEVPNPGYGIKYVKQEQSWEQLKVYISLTEPEPGMMYPQVISYPYLVGKVNLPPYTTISFLDASTGKPLFE
ncbi:stalk domain-containing protein [Brevibacillus dissolubilis]|uniref:stalk domain-containing protein n=1 Tax=Brevibacillus dissolubilis TaxID=1844116 RepID=UPI001117110A|nr:stalk domain-containing protein [Brevibacillus dissolubilis]